MNPADIGGRYSALSFFGMVPAALMGADLDRLIAGARDNGIGLPGGRRGAEPGTRARGVDGGGRRCLGATRSRSSARTHCVRSACGSSSSSRRARASRARASCRSPANRPRLPWSDDRVAVDHLPGRRRPTRHVRICSDVPGPRWRWPTPTPSAPSSCAGRSRRPPPACCSASIRSTNRTCSRRKTPRAHLLDIYQQRRQLPLPEVAGVRRRRPADTQSAAANRRSNGTAATAFLRLAGDDDLRLSAGLSAA